MPYKRFITIAEQLEAMLFSHVYHRLLHNVFGAFVLLVYRLNYRQKNAFCYWPCLAVVAQRAGIIASPISVFLGLQIYHHHSQSNYKHANAEKKTKRIVCIKSMAHQFSWQFSRNHCALSDELYLVLVKNVVRFERKVEHNSIKEEVNFISGENSHLQIALVNRERRKKYPQ